MRVSEVNITPVKPNNGLVGIASVVIDGNLYLNSIAIYTKLEGSYRLLYPTKIVGNRSLGLFYPINREASKAIEDAVFKKCNEVFESPNVNDRHSENNFIL
ncbi:MAG: septation protein SpoVG family protein [Candidatus Saccharimonadales bacterium]